MYNDNNENDSQYRYSGSDIPYNNTNNSSTANNNTAFSSAPYEAKKHKKHKGGFAKKAACFVLSAVLFGAIAGSVMFGVNYAGGKIAGSNKSDATGVNIPTVSNNISNVAKTDSSLTEDTNLSASGKMDVEAVATAALPAMVQLNGTTTVKNSSYFGYGQSYEATSSGTGIIVGKSDTELLIVTNAHVVDNIDNALLIAKKYKYSLRIVTLEGEQLNPGGSMTGGAFKNSSNLLGRRREIEELKKSVSELSKSSTELKTKIADNRAKIASIRELIDADNKANRAVSYTHLTLPTNSLV